MRRDDPDPALVRAAVDRIFPRTAPNRVERVSEGVSTFVYRVWRGGETFYLRVLPEEGASFAPEARVHALLLARGVRVPEVDYFEHCDEWLGRSVMVTTEIRGCHVGRRAPDEEMQRVIAEAGRQLALINGVPVTGFGWLRRDQREVLDLEAEHGTNRAFLTEHLGADLMLLEERAVLRREIDAIREIIERHDAWLDGDEGWLAHGDFDATHIFQDRGRYSGIIDFGEVRGTDRWYDLGHFRMHDGETLPVPVLDWLLDGYGEMAALPPDAVKRICFAGLLIAIRALARAVEKRRPGLHRHQALISIPRDIAVLAP